VNAKIKGDRPQVWPWIFLGTILLSAISSIEAQEPAMTLPKRGVATYAPKPEYSFEARSHWLEGSGVFELTVGPDGTVESVRVAKSTGHRESDESAMAAFRHWRFKPGAVAPKVKIPMEFTLAGLRPSGINAALRAEKDGHPPPGRKSSWRKHWEECIAAWNAYHRTDYEEYFRKQRKALGLADIDKL
jgi:TonB family protein